MKRSVARRAVYVMAIMAMTLLGATILGPKAASAAAGDLLITGTITMGVTTELFPGCLIILADQGGGNASGVLLCDGSTDPVDEETGCFYFSVLANDSLINDGGGLARQILSSVLVEIWCGTATEREIECGVLLPGVYTLNSVNWFLNNQGLWEGDFVGSSEVGEGYTFDEGCNPMLEALIEIAFLGGDGEFGANLHKILHEG